MYTKACVILIKDAPVNKKIPDFTAFMTLSCEVKSVEPTFLASSFLSASLSSWELLENILLPLLSANHDELSQDPPRFVCIRAVAPSDADFVNNRRFSDNRLVLGVRNGESDDSDSLASFSMFSLARFSFGLVFSSSMTSSNEMRRVFCSGSERECLCLCSAGGTRRDVSGTWVFVTGDVTCSCAGWLLKLSRCRTGCCVVYECVGLS